MKRHFLPLILLAISTVVSAQGPGRFRQGEPSGKLPHGAAEQNPKLVSAFAKAKLLRFTGKRLVTVVRAGTTESHTELVTKDGKNLRIEFANNSSYVGQIIVETDSMRRHFFPDTNEIKESGGSGRRQFESMMQSRFSGKLKVDVTDGGVVAGTRTEKFLMSDGRGNRVAELYIDPNSGLTMKRVVFDGTGSVAGSFEFLQVNWNPKIQPGAFTIARKGAKIIRPSDELRKLATEMGLPALRIPKLGGYRLESVTKRRVGEGEVLMLMFGKESGRLSLFASKADMPKNQRVRGATGVYRWNQSGVHFVLIGDESAETLRAFANSFSK